MNAPLRVNPGDLTSAAAVEADVAAVVAGLQTGAALSSAAAGLAGLSSGAACQQASQSVDGATGTIAADLTAHGDRLQAAAGRYRSTDESEAARLKGVAGQ